MSKIAKRFIYSVSKNKDKFIDIISVDFKWYPGFAISQKQKSIQSLHEEYEKISGKSNILEISSKSKDELGVKLSAFNLMINSKDNRKFSVECAFQSSKVFENGGPYVDLLNVSSKEAKKDIRLKTSGKLIGFMFYNTKWRLEPKTFFYDWLYMRALYLNSDLANEIVKYDAFSDIEFNPDRSINCQAAAAALFVSLKRRNLLDVAMSSISNYKKILLDGHDKNNSNQEQVKFNL